MSKGHDVMRENTLLHLKNAAISARSVLGPGARAYTIDGELHIYLDEGARLTQDMETTADYIERIRPDGTAVVLKLRDNPLPTRSLSIATEPRKLQSP